jgi:putative aldouronate transport system permease protein
VSQDSPITTVLEAIKPSDAQVVKPRAKRRRFNLTLMLMTLPGLLMLLLFSYLPMAGAVIAFKDYRAVDGLFGSAWVGFKNFEFLLGSGAIWRITWNTIFLNSLFILSGLGVGLLLALLIYEVRTANRWLIRFYQSAFFFPFFISYIIVGYFGYALLNTDYGLLNRLLSTVGLQSVNWYGEPRYWPLILVLVNLWKNVGFSVVIYLSGALAIDTAYFEAAALDGATKWQQARFITLPLLAPLITINVLLQVGRIFFADFGLFYNVTRDSSLLYPTTDVIDTYVFRALRTLGDFGMSGAAGLYQSVVGFALVLASNWIVKRRDPDRALF